MVPGPTEAFTPEQLAQLYDINVLSTQRVNRTPGRSPAQSRQSFMPLRQTAVPRIHRPLGEVFRYLGLQDLLTPRVQG
jgi:hypothetical protein